MQRYTVQKIMFSAILGIFSFSIFAMEFPEFPEAQPSFWDHFKKRKDFIPCAQVKSLKSDAPESEYRDVAKNLRKNNLTVCDCMKYLLWQKKKKAFERLDQQVPGATQKILEEKKALDKIDGIFNKTENFSVTCGQDIPQELCAFATKEYKKNKTARDLRIALNNNLKDCNICCRYEVVGDIECTRLRNVIELNKNVLICSKKDRQGSIIHEIAHLNYNINFTLASLLQLSAKHFDENYLPTVQPAMEAEADRLPAACDCLETAKYCEASSKALERDFWKSMCFIKEYTIATTNCPVSDQQIEIIEKKIISKEKAQLWDGFKEMVKETNKKSDPGHPFTPSRAAWATKIRRLREMEEALKIKNEQNGR